MLASCQPRVAPTDPQIGAGSPALPIRLKSRVFAPPQGFDAQILRVFDGESDGRRVHVLIQFARATAPEERRTLERKFGVRFLDPVPEHAFFASMPASSAVARGLLAASDLVRWIGPIEPGDKIAPWLRTRGFPEHAVLAEGRVAAIVEFFGDVPVTAQKTLLDDHGADVVARWKPVNGWQVIAATKILWALSEAEAVKWIVEIPGPTQLDNDGVRGAVDADAVHPPAPYGLTGAGVTVAQLESRIPSKGHGDFFGRIGAGGFVGPVSDRSWAHDETVAINGRYDDGEAVYIDFDDSRTVSLGDSRITNLPGFGAVVDGGDPDVGRSLALFLTDAPDEVPAVAGELFADTVAANAMYSDGESIYRDNDFDRDVSVGDVRLTAASGFAAGSFVAAGDGDEGTSLKLFPTNPHDHPTHVAGTLMGDGAMSAANGGTPGQWKGVAPGVVLRSYRRDHRTDVLSDKYETAALNDVTITTNSWGTSHCDEVVPPDTCYDVNSEFYDAVAAGRRSDGTASGLPARMLIMGSAGNEGYVFRHTERIEYTVGSSTWVTGVDNGLFDFDGGGQPEGIYLDLDDDGVVSAADINIFGPVQSFALGAPLIAFTENEVFDETLVMFPGATNWDIGIYRDADNTQTVTPGDVRIKPSRIGFLTGDPTLTFPQGSVVAAGDGDIGNVLHPFTGWSTVRIPNSAKNTIEVANVASDTNLPSFSSGRGPTDDGRLKPDLAGPGSQSSGDLGVTSAFPGNLYEVNTGTSMATPAVAGVAALLTEWVRSSCAAVNPRPATLRALMLHGAEDLTQVRSLPIPYAGPDFVTGFGLAKAKGAVDLVGRHVEGTLTTLGFVDIPVTVTTAQPLKVTLVWDDPPWTANAAPSALTGILQNDLDLELIAPDGTRYTPWILDPAHPSRPAVTGKTPAGAPVPDADRDRRNPVEQVLVKTAMPGTWTIRVSAAMLNLAPQEFTIVSEALPITSSPCALGSSADVWMRDNPADTGAVPSTGLLWLSPDVWNRLDGDGGTAHENPEFGRLNHLYASVRNIGPAAAGATAVDVWIAPAATGLAWPGSFSYVGRLAVPNLGAGEVRQIGPLAWAPPDPTPSWHFCFYVKAVSLQDPITITESSQVDRNTRNSNNIVWRNLNVVDLQSSESVTFLTRNIREKPAAMDLVLRVPEAFLKSGAVRLRLSPALQKRWFEVADKAEGLVSLAGRYRVAGAPAPERARPRFVPGAEIAAGRPAPLYEVRAPVVEIPGLRMRSGEAQPVTLTFVSFEDTPAGTFDVDVLQRLDGVIVGGIRYRVRVGHAE